MPRGNQRPVPGRTGRWHRETTTAATRWRRGALAAALAGGLVAGLAACDDTRDRAVDCAKLAINVGDAVDDLERAALTAALDQDADQFTDAVRTDTERVVDRASTVDVQQAADSVFAAVDNVQDAINAGTDPDFGPLTDAVSELTRVCDPTPTPP